MISCKSRIAFVVTLASSCELTGSTEYCFSSPSPSPIRDAWRQQKARVGPAYLDRAKPCGKWCGNLTAQNGTRGLTQLASPTTSLRCSPGSVNPPPKSMYVPVDMYVTASPSATNGIVTAPPRHRPHRRPWTASHGGSDFA